MDDIKSKDDIVLFVNTFYQAVRNDQLIGPIFSSKIADDDWQRHLGRMHSFWNTVLFGEADYRGQPFSHHIRLGLEKEHFDRWMLLFTSTINKNFDGPKAIEVLDRADKMRIMFEAKLHDIKSNPNRYNLL